LKQEFYIFKLIRKRLFLFFSILPSLIFIFGVLIYPMVYSLYISLFEFSIAKPYYGLRFIALKNYIDIVYSFHFWNSLKVTFIFAVAVTFFEFILGLGLALLLQQEIIGRKVFISIILIPMMISPVITGVIWKLIYSPEISIFNYFLSLFRLPQIQWLATPSNALRALIIMDVWQWTSFMFLILLAGLQSLPKAPLEAALIDGASQLQRFRYITLPLMKRVIAIAIALRLFDALKIFDPVYVLTAGGPGLGTDVYSIFVYRIGFIHWHTGLASALCWVFMYIVLILTIIFFKIIKLKI